MNSGRNPKDQLIKKQELYIRQLEEQLAVYEAKDSGWKCWRMSGKNSEKTGRYILHFPAR